MALLSLRDIGKIYVSGGSVAVGLRGINLDFDIGEFVAVTGKSGSGKTTLLNMLSGMDTYEEGELYVDGEPTSHFEQKDWEIYRQKYISFIFQDYNIIDSFTVLQNVELALSYVDSPKERRAKALDLIERVGLTRFKNHKGSKLSGGQKQRTVIARALAKDSPIILADEPTGNLDAKTSEEIIALLAEISKDKLVVVVTHSAKELEKYATREIRIFDGTVERDMELKTAEKLPPPVFDNKKPKDRSFKRGMELGVFRFCAMPKLSFFMCMLMILSSIGTFFATLSTDFNFSSKSTAFVERDGRVVLTRQDGEIFKEGELEDLASELGAEEFSRYDYFYDTGISLRGTYTTDEDRIRAIRANLIAYVDEGKVKADIGKNPSDADDVLLVLPLEWKRVYGEKLSKNATVELCGTKFNISGIDYYIDNTKQPKAIFTKEGFDKCADRCFLNGYSFGSLKVQSNSKFLYSPNISAIKVDEKLSGKEAYLVINDYRLLNEVKKSLDKLSYELVWKKGTGFDQSMQSYKYSLADLTFVADKCVQGTAPTSVKEYDYYDGGMSYKEEVAYAYDSSYTELYVSPDTLDGILEGLLHPNYLQASLFFSNNAKMRNSIETLRDKGYFAYSTDHDFTPQGERLLNMITSFFGVCMWLVMLIFLSLFLYICSARAIVSKRGDIAILRSMGIENKIIKISMYAQTGLSMLPSLVVLAVVATLIYTSPKLNPMFPFLHASQYCGIIIGMMFINFYISRKYNKKMFKESVRKTLRGGAKE